jgi:transposase
MNTASLVPDDLWEAIEPLLPREPPKAKGGRPRIPDRAALGGIVFVLRTGCPWRLLPKELGCGSGTTCWRRLRDWQAAGIWARLHETLLNWLGDEAAVDWSRASADSVNVWAKRGRADGAEPRRPRQGRFHVPPRGRPPRHPISRSGFRSQRARRNAVAPARRCHPFDHWPAGEARAPSQAPRQAPRRQGLRLLTFTPRPARPRYHPTHCSPRHRCLAAIGQAPLGRGALPRLAARLSPPRCALRTTGRPAPGAAAPGLCHALSPVPHPGLTRHLERSSGCWRQPAFRATNTTVVS